MSLRIDVLFYRRLQFSSLNNYLAKTVALLVFFTAADAAASLALRAFYKDFSPWIGLLLQTAELLLAYFAFSCALALVVAKFVVSFLAYVTWLLAAAVAVSFGPAWTQLLQYFDANAHLSKAMVLNMANASSFPSEQMILLGNAALYSLVVFVIGAFVGLLAQKRWLHNGIR